MLSSPLSPVTGGKGVRGGWRISTGGHRLLRRSAAEAGVRMFSTLSVSLCPGHPGKRGQTPVPLPVSPLVGVDGPVSTVANAFVFPSPVLSISADRCIFIYSLRWSPLTASVCVDIHVVVAEQRCAPQAASCPSHGIFRRAPLWSLS